MRGRLARTKRRVPDMPALCISRMRKKLLLLLPLTAVGGRLSRQFVTRAYDRYMRPYKGTGESKKKARALLFGLM